MNEPNPFDSPESYAKETEPEAKKWYQITVVEWIVIAGIILVLIGLLMPATKTAKTSGHRERSSNNLRGIGIALLNYHDTYGTFPPTVVTDSDGRPLYSWRVLLLPFLEEPRDQALYDQFDLSQAWDSETNQPLVEQMPEVYTSPFLRRAEFPGMTTYLAVVDPEGKRTFLLPQEGRSLDEVPCGTGNVVMVVEFIDHPVIWTKPEDISPFKLINQTPIEQNELSYFPVLFDDASVHWMPRDDPRQLRKCLFCKDTESVDETSPQD